MKKINRESYILFFVIFVFELIAGYYVCYIKQIVPRDALSRAANAFYVLYIQPPHLGSIGFVWNPLPSILELPLMLLWTVYKPIASSALAGVFITSIFAAGSVVLIYKNCLYFKISKSYSILISVFYALNPFIFIYGFNGMSESIFFFFLIWIITQLTQWMMDEQPVHVVFMAVGLALAFLVRYEAVVFTIGIAISVAIIILFILNKEEKKKIKFKLSYAEGTFVLLFTPIAYTIICWMVVNYIIMGDWLYFLHSNYSNNAQSVNLIYFPDVMNAIGNNGKALYFVIKKSAAFLPLFFMIIVMRIFSKRLLKWDFLISIILVLSIIILHFYMLLVGKSFGWLRFFAYPLPIMMAWFPYELSKFNKSFKVKRRVAYLSGIVGLVISGVFVSFVLLNPAIATEEYGTIQQRSLADEQKRIAEYINNNLQNDTLLLDSFLTPDIILNLNKPQDIVTTASYNFYDAVKDPKAFGIDYILVSDSKISLNKLEALNVNYPDLFEKGADWCTLEKEFKRFKLFKIKGEKDEKTD